MCVRLTEVTLKSHWQTAEKESATGFQSWEMSQTHREEQNQISGTYIYTHCYDPWHRCCPINHPINMGRNTHFSVAYSETIELESIKPVY